MDVCELKRLEELIVETRNRRRQELNHTLMSIQKNIAKRYSNINKINVSVYLIFSFGCGWVRIFANTLLFDGNVVIHHFGVSTILFSFLKNTINTKMAKYYYDYYIFD